MKTTAEIAELIQSGQAGLCYAVTFEAWYGDSARAGYPDMVTDVLSIGVDPVGDGGTFGEGTIMWKDFDKGRRPTWQVPPTPSPQLCLFNDSWAAFAAVPGFWDLFGPLGAGHGPSVDEMRKALESIGFQDQTEYVQPSR